MVPLEEIVSLSSALKVVIQQRPDGLLQLVLYKWYNEGVPDHDFESSGWEAMPEGPHLTDSVETARRLARELLAQRGEPALSVGSTHDPCGGK